MRRSSILSMLAVAALTLAVAGPASANDTERWTDSFPVSNTFACGVVEDTTVTLDGTAYFDVDGTWLRDVLRFTYQASYTQVATGTTISYLTRQIVLADADEVSLMAHGAFVRAQGGARLLDVGRLVVDPGDGSTIFMSAQTLAIDDPTVFERYEAAICSLF
jgi:hypothetical protein